MARSNQTLKLALDIRYAEIKMSVDGAPNDKFQRYKEDHPGTKKQPSDPLFKPKQIGTVSSGLPMSSHFHNENSAAHHPYWSAGDHKDAAHTHMQHSHDLGIEKGTGQKELYDKHVQDSGGDEAHHDEQAKLHMQAHADKKKQFNAHEDQRQFMDLKERPRPTGTTRSGKPIVSVADHPLHKDYDWEDHKDAAKNHYQQSEAARTKGHDNVANYHDMQASQHMNQIEKKAPSNVVFHPSMMKHNPKEKPEPTPHYYNHDETKQKLEELDKTRDIPQEEEQAPFVQRASYRIACRYLLT